MATPVPPARKYHTWRLQKPPSAVWSPVLGQVMKVKQRARAFADKGFTTQVVAAGRVIEIRKEHRNTAFIGSKMPFELTSQQPNVFQLCIHRVEYADRRRAPMIARVALHMPGGVIEEFTSSAVVAAPVLAVQAWPCRAKHLPRFAIKDTRAAQDIVARAGGSSIIVTAAAVHENSVSHIDRRVALMFHTSDSKWVCSTCGKLFNSATDLARHDGITRLVGNLRVMSANGQLGHVFTAPTYRRADMWKRNAIQAIKAGNVKAAMDMAPTFRSKTFASQLTSKLSSLQANP